MLDRLPCDALRIIAEHKQVHNGISFACYCSRFSPQSACTVFRVELRLDDESVQRGLSSFFYEHLCSMLEEYGFLHASKTDSMVSWMRQDLPPAHVYNDFVASLLARIPQHAFAAVKPALLTSHTPPYRVCNVLTRRPNGEVSFGVTTDASSALRCVSRSLHAALSHDPPHDPRAWFDLKPQSPPMPKRRASTEAWCTPRLAHERAREEPL